MHEKQNITEERTSFSIVAKNKDIEVILDAIKEAESGVNDASDFEFGQASYRSVSGLEVIMVSVSVAFLTKFAERFGENLADWLAKKLKLQAKDGEKIIRGG